MSDSTTTSGLENSVTSRSSRPTYVVGIGASAGGLQPIESFFDNIPVDSGMAFVVVQHLSPDFKSLMDELLARHTKMPIHKVSDGVRVEANAIYLIPPEKDMALSNGTLLLTAQEAKRGLNLPIDVFFRSLAQDARERAIGIILSGTGSDGSRGIKDIREAGGLVLAQDNETATFDGMPRAAVSTGVVDLVCAPGDMPSRILDYSQHHDRESLQRAQFEETHAATPNRSVMSRIFQIYRQMHGIDFSLYKTATITRRLERRVKLTAATSTEEYVDNLEDDEAEAAVLFRDLLVEVTQFFRDPEAFELLRRKIVPEIIEKSDPTTELRVWVPGCATGEEAYSMAMVFQDCLDHMDRRQDFKVFATDVFQSSLETASTGFYPVDAMDNVSPDFRQRFFNQSNGVCNIKRELRTKVIFATNDLTADPPFTRIDLISCRNVLIYFETKVQKRVLSLFHFGLKTGGVLFLGPSETVGDLAPEFDAMDRHWRIYRKRRDIRLPDAARMPLTPVLGSVIREQSAPFVVQDPRPERHVWLSTMYDDLLAKYVPPSLLLNEHHELVHCFGDARLLLQQPEGKPTLDVLKMLEGGLRVAVSAALHRARQENQAVVYKGVRVAVGESEDALYQVCVEPYQKSSDGHYLVTLEKTEKLVATEGIVEDFQATEYSDERITHLERELSYTRETLQATVEELESSNEELQATNEELVASNEELQSTNEELHSVNEELYTVNAEHKQKIDELTQLTSDMDNLLVSTEIGTIFLDEDLQIRMYTPAISAAFTILEQDVGRPIDHIAYKLENPTLMEDIQHVLATGTPKQVEVTGHDGRTYLQQTQPYRLAEHIDSIGGIVLTLTDISAIKEAEQAQRTMMTLAQVNEELPDFAYAVSHDLQAPLRHISQYTEVLERAISDGDSDRVTKATGVLSTSASHLRSMIDALLTYSRVNSRGNPLASISLADPISEAIQELKTSIEFHQAKISLDEMPLANGDTSQLSVLFFHLFDNSLKYRAEANPEISVTCEEADGMVTVAVRDNGIGIEERHLEAVFTIFKRLGFKPDVPGSGVGLAICKRIVVRHRGRIWAERNEDEGVTIFVMLPLNQELLVD